MAERPRQEQQKEAVAPPPSPRGPMKILFILLPAMILLGGGGYVGWGLLRPSSVSESGQKAPEPQGPPPKVAMKPFVVNLQDIGEIPRYLKVEFDLELRPGSPTQEVEAKTAELRDSIIVLLSSKRSQELSTIEGKDRLREEILLRLNARLQSATVVRVFFKDFIIQ